MPFFPSSFSPGFPWIPNFGKPETVWKLFDMFGGTFFFRPLGPIPGPSHSLLFARLDRYGAGEKRGFLPWPTGPPTSVGARSRRPQRNGSASCQVDAQRMLMLSSTFGPTCAPAASKDAKQAEKKHKPIASATSHYMLFACWCYGCQLLAHRGAHFKLLGFKLLGKSCALSAHVPLGDRLIASF